MIACDDILNSLGDSSYKTAAPSVFAFLFSSLLIHITYGLASHSQIAREESTRKIAHYSVLKPCKQERRAQYTSHFCQHTGVVLYNVLHLVFPKDLSRDFMHLQMTPEALCFRVVRPSVRACVRVCSGLTLTSSLYFIVWCFCIYSFSCCSFSYYFLSGYFLCFIFATGVFRECSKSALTSDE